MRPSAPQTEESTRTRTGVNALYPHVVVSHNSRSVHVFKKQSVISVLDTFMQFYKVLFFSHFCVSVCGGVGVPFVVI